VKILDCVKTMQVAIVKFSLSAHLMKIAPLYSDPPFFTFWN